VTAVALIILLALALFFGWRRISWTADQYVDRMVSEALGERGGAR
jgi:hypothetical protein